MSFAMVSAAKSGTTWLQRLLSAHPQVHCAESRAFGHYFDPKNPTAIHITIETFVENLRRYYHPPAGADEAFYHQMLFSIVDSIGRTTLDHAGKTIYGEKVTPYWGTGSEVIQRLAAYNPAIRFIHLVRDPRDVVVSGFVHQANIRIGSNHPDAARYREQLEQQRVDDELLESNLALWTDTNQAAASADALFQLRMLLRYEDLLAHPQTHAAAMFEFIGANTAPTADCVERASFRSLSGGRSEGDEDRSSFFRKGVAGDWTNWLTDQQLRTINDRAGNLMASFGYAQEACA